MFLKGWKKFAQIVANCALGWRLNVSPELKTFKNVLLLPHMSSATVEGRIEMGEKVIVNIKTLADGHRPPDQVLPSML